MQKRAAEEKARAERLLAQRAPSKIIEDEHRSAPKNTVGGITFLPRVAERALYAPHPVAERCMVLVADYHSFLAGEKAYELEELSKALVRTRSVAPWIACGRHAVDRSVECASFAVVVVSLPLSAPGCLCLPLSLWTSLLICLCLPLSS